MGSFAEDVTARRQSQKPLVWLIEDLEKAADIIKKGLEESGYDVRIFTSHMLAADQIENGDKPAVILNDYDTSPDMNGEQFMAEIAKTVWKDVPVVGISKAGALNQLLLEAEPKKANFCVEKMYLIHAFDKNSKDASDQYLDTPIVREMMRKSFLSNLSDAISPGRSTVD